LRLLKEKRLPFPASSRDVLIKSEIRFIAVKEGIDLSGKEDLQTKVIVTMFKLLAEIERELISQRTKEGLAIARAKGKKLGRPKGSFGKSKLDGKKEEIKNYWLWAFQRRQLLK